MSSRGPAMSRSKSMERMNDPSDQAPEWRSVADPASSKHRPYRTRVNGEMRHLNQARYKN